jgi:hypothetical protein
MRTDALIESLSARGAPVRRHAALRALALWTGLGIALSFALMLAWLGPRPDLAQAAATGPYWMKFFYTLLFAAGAFWTVERLARPGASSRAQMIVEALPFAILAALALARLMTAPPAMRMPMTMGGSSDVCPWRIAILALPILAGAILGLRRLAPTRPVLAGAAAGLFAGAAGAFVYAFHCGESTMPFVAVWYTLGIVVAGVIGAASGRLLLRW